MAKVAVQSLDSKGEKAPDPHHSKGSRADKIGRGSGLGVRKGYDFRGYS